jgi:hypothetical protein
VTDEKATKRPATDVDMTHASGWGAVVRGDPLDLQVWAGELKRPFKPWVEAHGNDTVLRSTSFDQFKSAAEVRERAIFCIDRLNGALAMSLEARPLKFGGVVEFDPDGRLHRFLLAEPGEYFIRGARARLTVAVLHPPAPPRPSEVQVWNQIAEREKHLGDALMHFGRATNWFDICKALECLCDWSGGSWAELKNLNWVPPSEIDLLKRSANWSRHARSNPPPKPMNLREARILVGLLLRRAFKEVARRF